jgi:hypothetical protein
VTHENGSFALGFDAMDNDATCGTVSGRIIIVLWNDGASQYFSLTFDPAGDHHVQLRDGLGNAAGCSLP